MVGVTLSNTPNSPSRNMAGAMNTKQAKFVLPERTEGQAGAIIVKLLHFGNSQVIPPNPDSYFVN
jgi:hypothetical protein